MLPHAGRHPYDDGTVEGRMGGIASGGYMAVARSSAELGAILDKIKVGGWVFRGLVRGGVGAGGHPGQIKVGCRVGGAWRV